MKSATAQKSLSKACTLKLAALALGSSLLLAGCAGNPPTAQMAVTQSAVNEAEWDARLATRKTQAAKADAALKDAQNSIQQIREEGQINLQLQQNLQKKVQQ